MVNRSLARHLRLPLVDTTKRPMRGYTSSGPSPGGTQGVAVMDIEISGHLQRIYAHVVDDLEPDLFLGNPWMVQNDVKYEAASQRVTHGKGKIRVYLSDQEEPDNVLAIRRARLLPAAPFATVCRMVQKKSSRGPPAHVMAASLQDIEKALEKLELQKPECITNAPS
ncbi:hypothetical protein CSOJ01_15864 [Colletotrichum sojae]|uniref:Uncharacterized protein n=1 Tax=Colletotrichum sojae TaxID=2175907 RepID=A0A8H6IM42_9PEZI|nr:hypothetical protein CSOJ01_15864 [Colletotrichum sojae]